MTSDGQAFRFGLQYVTDFADQAVILPVLATVVVLLAWQGWRHGARSWAVAAAACLGSVFLLKLGFGVHPVPGLRNPSGHAAVAALVGGGLGALALSQARLARAPAFVPALIAALVLGAASALAVGYTRVALDHHTMPESVLGGLVGTAGAVLVALLQGAVPVAVQRRRVAAAVLVVALALHGAHLNVEPLIHRLVRNVAAFDRPPDLPSGPPAPRAL